MAKLGAMPRILCWKCRRLTPFELERCQHCGAAFAGSTGGVYGSATKQAPRSPPGRGASRSSPRSLKDILEDLERIHDAAPPPQERATDSGDSASLYQCPTCGRFVSERSTQCLCGARFGPGPTEAYLCPECACRVPSDAHACPVCGVGFVVGGARSENVYACPRCGAHVASDAVRCGCGAWFED